MPPKRRGIAAVKKAPSKYIVVDSDSEPVDGGGGDGGDGDSDHGPPAPTSTRQKKSSVPREATPQRRSRQEKNGRDTPVAGQSSLAQTLFHNDDDDDGDDDIPPPGIRESIETPANGFTNGSALKDKASKPPSALSQQSSDQAVSSLLNRTDSLQLTPRPSNRTRTSTSTVTVGRPRASPHRNRPPANSVPVPVPGPSEMSYIPTSQARHMRACMVCSIVRTYTMFMQSGCPNCDSFLELTGNADAIQDCTSQVFEGLLTVSNTSKSWVARYQRLEGYIPGIYAIQVEGILPEDAVVAAEQAGVHYIPRDGSVSEALPTEG